MRARVVTALLAVALALAGCESSVSPAPATVSPVEAWPSGEKPVTTAPNAGKAECDDPEASLRPGPLPSPGAMPPGSTMAEIAKRGRLIVGVDQNTYFFGSRNPASGQPEGFDIDLAKEIARSIFGDPDRMDPRVVDASQRESALQSGLVDLVVRTYTITCARKESVDFSTVYYYAHQKILAAKGSGIHSAADLSGKRVCAVSGTTSLSRLFALNPRPTLLEASTWTDCLVLFQQGQVDAISTDDVVLRGLAKQDPTVEVVGEDMSVEPYGVGVKKENSDLVKFVNGVLEQIRNDGTWERLYDAHLRNSLGPSPGPPMAKYKD
ncbi:MAG: polar amino acid transport system substrate-binding protein [Mycobacterium sp.]|nr:polar amino acid transport system substrate-binding protein [Mycobacterium sp.]